MARFMFGAAVIFLLVWVGTLSAQTQVGGLLLEDTTWNEAGSPYVVGSSLIIGNGATLTIGPNVVVKVDRELSILVGSESDGEGALVAAGEAGQAVTFTSNAVSPGAGDWGHIHFSQYAHGAVIATEYDPYQQPGPSQYESGCKLENVVIEYGGYGDCAVVFVEDSRVYLNRCEIRNNLGFGVAIYDSTGARDLVNDLDFPLVRDCDVWGNGGGLYMEDVDNYSILDSQIHENRGPGIVLDSGSWNLLQGNTIYSNRYWPQSWSLDYHSGGLVLESGSYNEIVGNIICHNASLQNGGGIGMYSGHNNVFVENVICNNSAEASGGGIYSISYSTFTANVICGNTADENGGGVFCSGGTFAGNTIEENFARYGGGFYGGAGTTIDETVIRHNDCEQEGGGAYVYGQITIRDSWILHNGKGRGQTGGVFVADDASWVDLAGDVSESRYNHIWGNEGYQLYNDCPLVGDNNLESQYVCWGTDGTEEIQAGIFDFFDDSTHAFVYWDPAAICSAEEPDPSGSGCPAGLNGYGGGYGTEGSPYLIYTAEQLQNVGEYFFDWDKHFRLMADIDLDDLGGAAFHVIGGPPTVNPFSPGIGFSGVFDGNGHEIAHFRHVSRGLSDIGLFGLVDGGEIRNLGLLSPYMDVGGGNNVGSLVGYGIYYPVIDDCYVEGGTIVDGGETVGGLVGTIHGTLTNCHASCDVSGSTSVGGLLGALHTNDTIVSHCYATGNVQGDDIYVGGLIGYGGYAGSEISDCHASGDIRGADQVGGLIGASSGSTIYDCYATGMVEGEESVGGLVGWGNTLERCYATGDVYGIGYVGGLVGSGSDIYDCFATGDVFVVDGVGPRPGNFGGLAGTATGEISGCFATGDVNASEVGSAQDVGGLIGENSATTFDCYARGSAFGDRHIGGLIGNNHSALFRCYATGIVSGEDQVAGIAGYEETWGDEVYDCFWDTQSSQMPTSKGGTGKTTAQMYDQNTFLEAGWDFVDETGNGTEDIWEMLAADYPHLAWEAEQVTGESYELTVAVSGEGGDIVPGAGRYSYQQGSKVTLAAAPAAGYRVKSWEGTDDDLSQARINTVTMDGDKNVTVVFEEIEEDALTIAAMRIKASFDRDEPSDSITISCESFDVAAETWHEGEGIRVYLFNAYEQEAIWSDVICFSAAKMRNGRYRDQNEAMGILFDLDKRTLRVSARNIDLTGLRSPVVFRIETDDSIGSGLAYEDGSKSMPAALLCGSANFLRVDKCVLRMNTRKPDSDCVEIQGAIAIEETGIDIATEDVVIHLDDYEITLSADDLHRIGQKRVFRYRRPRGSDSIVGAALLDLEKCVFKIILRNANIDVSGGSVEFGLAFDTFDMAVTVPLSESGSHLWRFP